MPKHLTPTIDNINRHRCGDSDSVEAIHHSVGVDDCNNTKTKYTNTQKSYW